MAQQMIDRMRQHQSEPKRLYFIRLRSDACSPCLANPCSAVYNLAVCETSIIPPHSWVTVHTGIRILMPEGWYGRISGRHSAASIDGLMVVSSIVDYNTPDEIRLVVFNMNACETSVLRRGRAIAQLIIGRCATPPVRELTRHNQQQQQQMEEERRHQSQAEDEEGRQQQENTPPVTQQDPRLRKRHAEADEAAAKRMVAPVISKLKKFSR